MAKRESLKHVLNKEPKSFWVLRLKLFISNVHKQVTPYLGLVVGHKAATSFYLDLCQLQLSLVSTEGAPPNLVQTTKA